MAGAAASAREALIEEKDALPRRPARAQPEIRPEADALLAFAADRGRALDGRARRADASCDQHVLNLQSLVFPHFGTNGPLWSLACEFWYYIAFPLLTLPFARRYGLATRAGGFALGAALVAALSGPGNWFAFGFVLWAIGAFATRAPRPLIRSRWLSLALFAAAIAVIRLVIRGSLLAAHPFASGAADLSAALLFANLLLAFRDAPQEGFSALRWKLHAPLADFSFSLYAIHMPIVIFARAAVGHFVGRDWAMQLATGANYAVALAVAATAVVSAYAFSRLTEAKTGVVRKALDNAFARLAWGSEGRAAGYRGVSPRVEAKSEQRELIPDGDS
ncbi:acyltransferase family protein [Methylocystis parvus]|uniref:acyltransferase family protein n=1 Tax=Methylocystis parvus TaxID=134 RepID=UPI003C78D3BD